MKPGIKEPVAKNATLFSKWVFVPWILSDISGSVCTIHNIICLCTSGSVCTMHILYMFMHFWFCLYNA